MTDPIDSAIEKVILEGRTDLPRWAALGFGVIFHDKQVYFLEELEDPDASYFILFGANRAGKTLPIIFKHLHMTFYKLGLPEPTTPYEHKQWVAEDYRTLHAAPTNGLVGKHWAYAGELIKGTHPAQRDEDGRRREAPLGAMFTTGSESVGGAGEHLVIKCLTGGTVDMYSTEGDATRIESMPWRFGTWDEWSLQEAADKGTAIRTVLNRLTTRLSDYDGKLVLTGTLTPETEHIGRDFLAMAEDPDNRDWKAVQMTRFDNPHASRKAIELAARNMDEEDYKRIVLGEIGGVKGRIFPGYMVEPAFTTELPAFTPPHPEDGVRFEAAPQANIVRSRHREEDEDDLVSSIPRGRFLANGSSPWTYIHCWDLALAVADNVGLVLRLPADFRFSLDKPIIGVRRVVVPGSRTLTSDEMIHTIEETFLPYGGQIVLDATDAHGKHIYRTLRRRGYPVHAFVFNERDRRKVIKKDAAIINTRELLTEGMVLERDAAGEPRHDPDGVPIFDRNAPYGVIRLPRAWTRTRDQLSVLREDDSKQVKDEAMALLMGGDTAYRLRRSRTRQGSNQRFAVFAGTRRYGAH